MLHHGKARGLAENGRLPLRVHFTELLGHLIGPNKLGDHLAYMDCFHSMMINYHLGLS